MNIIIYILKDRHCDLIGFLSEMQSWFSIRNINIICHVNIIKQEQKTYDPFMDMEEVSNKNAMSIQLKKKLSFVRMKEFLNNGYL